VAFAGDAFLECPLTIDNTAFQQSVQALDVNTIPQGGTAIATAINTALTAFKEGDHYKVLVLLTDGEDNVSEPAALEAAQNAAKAGLKIFTIGIGTAEGTMLTRHGREWQFGLHPRPGRQRGEIAFERGAAATNRRRDRRFLSAVARREHDGHALRTRPRAAAEVGRQEKLVRRYHEQFQWPLAAAILLLLAEMFLPERKKSKVQSPPSKVKAPVVAALVAILLLPVAANASPASALRDYKSGNYTNALQEFERLAEVNTNDLRLVFNAGAAAYRATNFDAALDRFSDGDAVAGFEIAAAGVLQSGQHALPDGRT
jgi:Ca-activated chloride channel homolog